VTFLKAFQPRLIRDGLRLLALASLWVSSGLPFAVHAQQTYPGAALFTFQCSPSTITFFRQGTPVIQATFAQIAGPLAAAIATQQNQPIIFGNEVSLWALKSNEFQIHFNSNPDATKLVLSSGVCGAIPLAAGGVSIAFAQASGSGQLTAFAQVTSSGQATAFAQVEGAGQAIAYVQSSGAGARVHIVRRGENLFRISLRYHTTVTALVAVNGLSNPNLIYVGQVLYIP
jgi:nucleoid-associated protein YgaU